MPSLQWNSATDNARDIDWNLRFMSTSLFLLIHLKQSRIITNNEEGREEEIWEQHLTISMTRSSAGNTDGKKVSLLLTTRTEEYIGIKEVT